MRFSTILGAALVALTNAQSPGYNATFSTVPANSTFSFGQHYAVLNLDMINLIVDNLNTSTAGQAWINSCSSWINAVHQQRPAPLSIYTRIYLSTKKRPEIGPGTQFGAGLQLTAGNPLSQIYPAFKHGNANDVILQKSRYYAGAGNGLEEILDAQQIDTVILSGVRTSGVIVSTAYRLFDLNYKVYIISGNVIETPPDNGINLGILNGIAKLPGYIITLEQAMEALGRSGPAIY